MSLPDQSISISNDLMFNMDLAQSILAEYEQWRDGGKIVAKIIELQFKENTWQFVENKPAEGLYKTKTIRMFACTEFNNELLAVATYRTADENEMFEYVEYTTKASVDRKKAFKEALNTALKEKADAAAAEKQAKEPTGI